MIMADLYRVKAPVVKVSIGSLEGNRVARILRAGGLVPAGVAEKSLQKLEDRGLIEKVAVEQEVPEADFAEDEPAAAAKAEAEKVAAEKAAAEKAEADKVAARTSTAKK